MKNRKATLSSVWMSAALCLAVSVLGFGCGGEEEAPPMVQAAPPPPPAPPPRPAITPVTQLAAELNIDPRVVMSEDQAPDNDVDRKAVLVFFDAMARGNATSLKGMLPATDQMELAALVDSGVWQKTAAKIHKIEIQTGQYEENKCALAVIEVGSGADMSYQPQMWYYTADGDTQTFDAAQTPPGIMDRLSGDWIVAWHKILADDEQLAMAPEAEVQLAQRNLNEDDEEKPSSGGASGGAPGGMTPGGARPVPEPISPPG